MSAVEDTEKLWNYNLMCEKNVQKINHYTIQNVKPYIKWGESVMEAQIRMRILVARTWKRLIEKITCELGMKVVRISASTWDIQCRTDNDVSKSISMEKYRPCLEMTSSLEVGTLGQTVCLNVCMGS